MTGIYITYGTLHVIVGKASQTVNSQLKIQIIRHYPATSVLFFLLEGDLLTVSGTNVGRFRETKHFKKLRVIH